ncbi:MAG TPA: DEAD/DEAH box helicase [Acidimicrobiia bacterium]|nr:DEAD/DEAH box helicase [Acidimicrobiia bacterium]
MLERFSPPVRDWFASAFAAPTRAQHLGWPAIGAGDHTLLLAPTGSGKTLAAFLWAVDRLATDPEGPPATRDRVLYVSPLKALAVDIERNLRAPLIGLQRSAARLGVDVRVPTVGVRTGDTPADERRRLVRTPPDILITTPESLYLMLTSRARETLRSVRWVIVDEIHAVAGTKRGAHLALSLERLEELTRRSPQRIGLSATQRPLDEIARFLGGVGPDGPRPVTVVDAGSGKDLDVEVVVPVEDLGAMGRALDEPVSGPADAGPPRASIWPHVHPRLLELVLAHRSTIIFVNARRLAERLAASLNDLWHEQLAAAGQTAAPGVELVRAHHGSIAREQRLAIEDALKRGEVRALVATSSLELGIDMGAVDLVIQVESPGSVARGLQRIGRAGHGVGESSRGKIFPKYRGDLLEAAVVVPRMRAGLVEETRYPRNPLDVLAQQLVAACAVDEWDVDALLALVRRAANFADLPDDAFTAVLDLLAGRYPSDEFSGLRPRLVWDRVAGRVRARDGAARVAIVNGGTIPDRGLFGVFLPDGVRVGELDEEMVYESRPGDIFVLGASTWRIDQITHDRVIVTPAPGEPARAPFWKGDKPGRPLELGRALGAAVRELTALAPDAARRRLADDFGLDALAAENLRRYLEEQRDATGSVPDDRTVVVERFPDEIGDWRVCVLSPFGARVHAPWALALEARLNERLDLPVEVLWSDDGIVLRLPEAVDTIPTEELLLDPDEVEELVTRQLPATALFAARFREAAARALLLPRRRPGERTPLWQQRQRAADLLEVAARYPSFPIVLEATRECLRDVFDLAALRTVLADLRARRVRVVPVETPTASPFAQSLLFGWIAVYMYEGDAPLAERRAAALALDRDLLRELLGADELRELLDADAVETVELELARLAPTSRRAQSADDVHDLLRDLGDLSEGELTARTDGEVGPIVAGLERDRRAIRITVAGEPRVAAAEDAARYRDATGAAIPVGLPGVFTAPTEDPLGELLARYARTHGPFTTAEAAGRFGVPEAEARATLEGLEERRRVVRGEFRPGGSSREWCDVDVLRRLRRRSLAALRREIEPVDPEVLARFASAWQGVARPRRGVDALLDALSQLQGASVPASVLEVDVLGSRVEGYRPSMLDELCASGDLVWIGNGAIGATDGRVVLAFRDQAPLLTPPPPDDAPSGPVHDALRDHLARAGASFWPELVRATGEADERVVLDALWDLVWAGVVTNDGLAALRARLSGRPRAPRGRPRPGRLARLGPPAAAGRWSLVSLTAGEPPSPTEVIAARARQLLERHGVVTRETVRAEGWPGGFAAVYPALRAMEEAGRARRGYFVAGLGAAQFALPGAADRLRGEREAEDEVVVLAATDPAQPYGAALPWPDTPGRPARVPGALVVLHGGQPAAYLERGAKRVLTFDAEPSQWVGALTELVKNGRLRSLTIERVDDVPARESPTAPSLRAAGFVDGYRGLRFGP